MAEPADDDEGPRLEPVAETAALPMSRRRRSEGAFLEVLLGSVGRPDSQHDESPEQQKSGSGSGSDDTNTDASHEDVEDEAAEVEATPASGEFRRRRCRWSSWFHEADLNGTAEGPHTPPSIAALQKFSAERPVDDVGIVLRDTLFHAKGTWGTSSNIGARIVELRRLEDGREHQLSWQHLNKAGQADDKVAPRRLDSLRGSVAEVVSSVEQPNLYCWRLHALPSVREDPMDFACSMDADRSSWLNSLSTASKHVHDPAVPLNGRLYISLCQGTLLQDAAAAKRSPASEVFVVAHFNGMSIRTVPRRWAAQAADSGDAATLCAPADFGSQEMEFPVTDDNPDAKVTFELWFLEKGRRSRRYGCVHVPLFTFGRVAEERLSVPVWDAANTNGRDGDEIGSLTFRGRFEQPFISLLLPAPPRSACRAKWKTVGNKPLREQFRELEEFMKEFEIFSNRFMYHCDMWRDTSQWLRGLVEWDSPLATLALLTFLTLVIGPLYEYSLLIAILIVFCFAAWYHPRCVAARGRYTPWWQSRCKHRRCPPRRRRLARLRLRLRLDCCRRRRQDRDPPAVAGADEGIAIPEPVCLPSEQSSDAGPRRRASASLGESALLAPRVKELYENERRMVFGRFSSNRLRLLLDPSAWSTRDGQRAEAPRQVEDGVTYVWRVDVTNSTDSDGWQYARSFGRGILWRSTFNPQLFVRRRRHIGCPTGLLGDEAPVADGAQHSPCTAIADDPSPPTGSFRRLFSQSATTTPTGASPSMPSMPESPREKRSRTFIEHERPRQSPEFGIAKTPYHDMLQQYLLRWVFLQRQIEYWMDWYEKRKNLLMGSTLSTHNLALVAIALLLVVAMFVPARLLILVWVYSFFQQGMSQGGLMRKNQQTFISAVKEAAITLWLDGDAAKAQAKEWGPGTQMDIVMNSGVRPLVLRDWVQNEYFEGRPMVPLRTVQCCSSLGELARRVTWTSERFDRRLGRARVWWRSTVRNLLDHVRSDITFFEPMTHTGWTEKSA